MSENDQASIYKFGPGDFRKLSILTILIATIYWQNSLGDSFYWVLASLIFLYSVDVFYTITVSQRTDVDLKAFIFQTAVPIFALTVTGVVAIACEVESSVIVTMFGISLAYTTYVVGNPIKSLPNDKAESDENKSNIPPNLNKDRC